jgi:hypothetical protein
VGPLESLYPIIYVDCLVVNVRENQRVINKALYLGLPEFFGDLKVEDYLICCS